VRLFVVVVVDMVVDVDGFWGTSELSIESKADHDHDHVYVYVYVYADER
jgi:hypothetical protein